MKIPCFEIKGIGVRTTARGIGEYTKFVTEDPLFFKLSEHAEETAGDHFNTVIYPLFKEVFTVGNGKRFGTTLKAYDLLEAKEDDNKVLFEHLEAKGWIKPADYKKYHSLTLYSLHAAEYAIRLLIQDRNFKICDRITVSWDYASIDCVATFKDPSKQYNRSENKLGLYARKNVLPKMTAVQQAEAEADEELNKFTRKYYGRGIIDMFPEDSRADIQFYSRLCKAARLFKEANKVLDSDNVDELTKQYVQLRIEEYFKNQSY